MQRKVAYVFLYKNGIRERSVGILRRYGTAEQPEVALELFGEVSKHTWRIFYFTKGEALMEAAYLWGTTTERGRSETRVLQCRLCAEAGAGEGIVLLPEQTIVDAKQIDEVDAMNGPEQMGPHIRTGRMQETDRANLREYLCARYDGREVTEQELSEAFRRKPVTVPEENLCIESAKRLMEEITRAADCEAVEGSLTAYREGFSEEVGGEIRGRLPKQRAKADGKEQKRGRKKISYLEELLFLKPPYVPCRRYDVEYSVRITPEELICLPKENKKYTENSFVFHGYYRYRHLLLGRRTRKEREDYVLLVPGNFNEKEAKLAELFGFPEFLPIASAKPETGDAASGKELFGYFCGKI